MTLGFTHSTVYEVLPRALQAFRARYPEVELDLRQFTSGLLVEGVRTGRVDLALVRFSPSMQDPELRSAVIARDPMLLVMPADHPLAGLSSVPVDALHGLPFVGYSAEDSRYFHEIVEALFVRHGVRPEVMHTSFLPTLVALVEARMGVALVPGPAVPRGASALAARPLTGVRDGLDRADLHCVWRGDNANPVVRSFIDVLSPAASEPPQS